MKKYIINYTNIPTEGHQYRITLEETVFGKIIEEYLRWTKEERDNIVATLNEKLGGAEIKLYIY